MIWLTPEQSEVLRICKAAHPHAVAVSNRTWEKMNKVDWRSCKVLCRLGYLSRDHGPDGPMVRWVKDPMTVAEYYAAKEARRTAKIATPVKPS